MSANFSCYGETAVATPNVDKLAADGTRFSRAYVTAPVCSACRSALITGMVQTSIGSHHHRSGRGELKIQLPDGVSPLPLLFQKAGYFTCIGSGLVDKDYRGIPIVPRNGVKVKEKPTGPIGKTDYNFEWDSAMYDSHDWAGRDEKQPFFMQVQLHGGKLREGTVQAREAFHLRVLKEFGSAVDPSKITLPPYYPRDPVLLDDWAAYLDSVRLTDQHVGEVIARLESEGLFENTLVIFMTDHGISHARGKQFLYDEGTRIPLVIRGPGISKTKVRDDLVEHIDIAAISLAAAGIPIPIKVQGRNLFASKFQPHESVFAARDRCDETVERIRSVRTDRFLYVRNFFPQRPHLQPNAYKDGKAIVQALRAAHTAGTLLPISEKLLFSPTRPTEELYEYGADPWQVNNLAADPTFRTELESHRAKLDEWIETTQDKGFESDFMYDSDMQEYIKKPNAEVEKNIALMKQWAKEGK